MVQYGETLTQGVDPMTAEIIDGRQISTDLKEALKVEMQDLKAKGIAFQHLPLC